MTDASGNCCIPVTANGTYSYEVAQDRFVTGTGNIIVSGGTSSITVGLTKVSGYICCGPRPIPTTLNATGPNGSAALYFNFGSGTWDGCYGYTASVRTISFFYPHTGCDPPFSGGAVTALRFICGTPPVLSKTVWGCDIIGGVMRGPGADQHCDPATGAASSDGGPSSSDTGIGTGTLDPVNLSFTVGGPFDAGGFTVTE
jgi:hypothetical protein